MLWIGLIIGVIVGWTFPQPKWVADAWAAAKAKWF